MVLLGIIIFLAIGLPFYPHKFQLLILTVSPLSYYYYLGLAFHAVDVGWTTRFGSGIFNGLFLVTATVTL
jgi:hypothetical protein